MRKLNNYKESTATFFVKNTSMVLRNTIVSIKRIVFLILASHLIQLSVVAQTIQSKLETAKELISDADYDQAYNTLQDITDGQVEKQGNAYVASFNYLKGSCLYYLSKYEDAIPFLQKGIQVMEKMPNKSCEYLEMIYGIGSCYKKIGTYQKAEEYFRKTILKGTYLELNCAIRNRTYAELAELYVLMGKPDFADICTSRIESEIRLSNSKDVKAQINVLWDLYKAHENMGKYEECINDLKKLRNLTEENNGKNNKKYLAYSSLLGIHLRYRCNRPQEAAVIHKEMIEIGKQFKTYRNEICNAYLDYLRFLAENNKVDSVEIILPSAIKYYNNTKDKRDEEENLYEIVGNGLCDAENYDKGIEYLEKKWKGESANSIKALGYLGDYYFYRKDDAKKAQNYYLNAERQIEEGLETTLGTKISILERLVLTSQRLGNTKEAVRYFETAEPYLTNQNDIETYVRFFVKWSSECAGSGDSNKAEELTQSLESFVNNNSNDIKIMLYSQMGFVFIKTGKYDKSIDNIVKGIDLALKVKGEKCRELETLYHNLGRAYMLKEDYTKALSALNKSKNLQLELEGEVMQRTADYIKECESK